MVCWPCQAAGPNKPAFSLKIVVFGFGTMGLFVLQLAWPYKFMGFGDIHGTKAYELIGSGDIRGPKAHKFIRFGDTHGLINLKGLVTSMARNHVNV